MKNPIIMVAVYLLCIAAILFSMTGGGSSDSDTSTEIANAVKTDAEEVDLSKAPPLEPSKLTDALVTGSGTEESDKEMVETATETEGAEKASTDDEEKPAEETNTASTQTEEEKASTENTESETSSEPEKTVVATGEGSAADYFKAHGVDPSLNAPAVASNTEEKEEQTAEAETAVASETDTQFSEISTDEMLLMAREAYWNNGLEESAQLYQQLISSSPDVIDYKGELGNVYWRQGFPKKAAEMYAEISLPMIEEGNTDKVANMVGFIGLFFPEKATEIHNKLQEIK